MENLSELNGKLVAYPHHRDQVSRSFQYRTHRSNATVLLSGQIARIQARDKLPDGTELSTVFIKTPGRTSIDNLRYLMQCESLNTIVNEEMAAAQNRSEEFVIVDKWTSNTPYSPATTGLEFHAPSTTYIAVQFTEFCSHWQSGDSQMLPLQARRIFNQIKRRKCTCIGTLRSLKQHQILDNNNDAGIKGSECHLEPHGFTEQLGCYVPTQELLQQNIEKTELVWNLQNAGNKGRMKGWVERERIERSEK
ncbi:hypothetical protein FB451DRAFT_1191334 [Mycena latifolia]|nr:hypothetical protein FB451DRAFT_1191334 [Mycena latifolia]